MIEAIYIIKNVQQYLGTYATALEAARAYDQAAFNDGRPLNTLNCPDEWEGVARPEPTEISTMSNINALNAIKTSSSSNTNQTSPLNALDKINTALDEICNGSSPRDEQTYLLLKAVHCSLTTNNVPRIVYQLEYFYRKGDVCHDSIGRLPAETDYPCSSFPSSSRYGLVKDILSRYRPVRLRNVLQSIADWFFSNEVVWTDKDCHDYEVMEYYTMIEHFHTLIHTDA